MYSCSLRALPGFADPSSGTTSIYHIRREAHTIRKLLRGCWLETHNHRRRTQTDMYTCAGSALYRHTYSCYMRHAQNRARAHQYMRYSLLLVDRSRRRTPGQFALRLDHWDHVHAAFSVSHTAGFGWSPKLSIYTLVLLFMLLGTTCILAVYRATCTRYQRGKVYQAHSLRLTLFVV